MRTALMPYLPTDLFTRLMILVLHPRHLLPRAGMVTTPLIRLAGPPGWSWGRRQ